MSIQNTCVKHDKEGLGFFNEAARASLSEENMEIPQWTQLLHSHRTQTRGSTKHDEQDADTGEWKLGWQFYT